MASWLVSNMAGWLKAEFSTCRIALKAVIYKSQKPRIKKKIKGSIYIFCPIVVAQWVQNIFENATAKSNIFNYSSK